MISVGCKTDDDGENSGISVCDMVQHFALVRGLHIMDSGTIDSNTTRLRV